MTHIRVHYEEDEIISAYTLLKDWNNKGNGNGRSLYLHKLKTFGTIIFEGILTSINNKYQSILCFITNTKKIFKCIHFIV